MPICPGDAITVVHLECSAQAMMASCCVITVNTLLLVACSPLTYPPEFGVYVDKQGNPNRTTGIVEWEGTADKVAMHSPYVLLFDPRFIEVRHVETGRLIQIIPGSDIRCVWDGRSVDPSSTFAPPEGNEENMIQEPRVHAVMNVSDTPTQPGGRPMRGIVQHVFELYPTIPLYLPGALSSPSNAPFYPVSFSPPRSPPLRAGHL